MADYYVDLDLDSEEGIGTSTDPYGYENFLSRFKNTSLASPTFIIKGEHDYGDVDVQCDNKTGTVTVKSWIDASPARIICRNFEQYSLDATVHAQRLMIQVSGRIVHSVEYSTYVIFESCYITKDTSGDYLFSFRENCDLILKGCDIHGGGNIETSFIWWSAGGPPTGPINISNCYFSNSGSTADLLGTDGEFSGSYDYCAFYDGATPNDNGGVKGDNNIDNSGLTSVKSESTDITAITVATDLKCAGALKRSGNSTTRVSTDLLNLSWFGYPDIGCLNDVNTIFDDLLYGVYTKLNAVSDVVQVIIGTYGSVELEHRGASGFPCIEIVGNSYSGHDYIDGRNIRCRYSFTINAHTYTATADRVSGTDMKTLETFASLIKIKMFSFMEDTNIPCAGFKMTNSDYSLNLQYQEHTDNINTAEMTFNFIVDVDDTTK